MTGQQGDQGFTLIELLLVIVVLGLLATIVVASVGGVTGDAKQSACSADADVLYTATESFFAQRSATTLPSIGSTLDRYELGLAQEGFLRSASTYFDLAS